MEQSTTKQSLWARLRIHTSIAGLAALACMALLLMPSEPTASRFEVLPAELSNTNPIENPLSLSPQQASFLTPSWRTVRVKAGDTLATVFGQIGLTPQEMHDILDNHAEAAALQRLFPGQTFTFLVNAQGKLDQMKYQASVFESIVVRREGAGFAVDNIVRVPDIKTTYSHAVIDNSLFVDAQEAGMATRTVMDLANIFAWDIDLFEVQDGDAFSVLYEEKYLDGEKVENGDILAASFTYSGKTYTAVRYTNQAGETDYYSPEGLTMKKEFLRTPVDFARISSYFSTARKHPVLNTIRAHKGVDYAAPQGTPIKAAGKGKIAFAGKKNGYGNVVEIKHNGSYSTLYAHMKSFAKGVKSGSSVRQGQVIGYVGMTGLATGPHLHYEFHVNGKHVNPLSAKLPMADPIAANEKSRFLAATQSLIAQLNGSQKAEEVALNKTNNAHN